MPTSILRFVIGLQLGFARVAARTVLAADRGQSTAEYALVLAGIAGLVALVFAKTDVFQSIFTKAVAAVNKAIK